MKSEQISVLPIIDLAESNESKPENLNFRFLPIPLIISTLTLFGLINRRSNH